MTLLGQRFAILGIAFFLVLSLFAPRVQAGAYEAELPAELATAKDNDTAEKKLLGYVMLSTDITDTPAYSGKPVVTLIGMDLQGRFVGVQVLKHSEPILLLGIPESALVNFNNQYLGKSVKDTIEVGPSRPEENVIGLDAISG